MELALGLKITKTRDDIASISEYQLAKDKGPVFQSRETNTMFILSAYLKGYKRNDMDIQISKDGSKISISGKKPIQEMLMMGWVMHKKQVEITGFNRVFKIPTVVNLDKIKAKYDEEEWTLNIFMPKLVKGLCGVRIEEVKEEESEERGKSAQEKNETDNVLSSVGETSQKGSKEFEVQGMEGNEIKNEVESSKLGIEDGNGEILREKAVQEGHEVMKTTEKEKNVDVCVPQKLEADRSQDKESEFQKFESENVDKNVGRVFDKMLDDANGDITGDTSQKEIEETIGEKDSEAAFEAMETSEIEKDTPQKIGDKVSDIQGLKENGSFEEKKKKMVSNNINEEKQRGEAESTVEKMETEETRMILKSKSLTEKDKYGESKQKEFGEPRCEAEHRVKEKVKESSVERLEEMKTSELGETDSNHIPSYIVGVGSEEEFKQSRVQQMEKTESTEGKMDEGVSEKMPFEAKDIQKTSFGDTIHLDTKKPKIGPEGRDQECFREKVGKKGIDGVMTLCEQFPEHLPKDTHDKSEGMDVAKLQEIKDVKEEMDKRKGKEIEYFVEKGEGVELKGMPVEAKIGKTKEVMQEKIGKSKNGTKDSGQQQVLEITGKGRFGLSNSITEQQDENKGFKGANVEELREVIKEAMVETEALSENVNEEEASKKRTEEVIEKSTVTETLEKETEDSKIKRKARDKPHAAVFVVNDPMTQRKEKGHQGLQEDMSKGRFQGSKAAKEEFPTKLVDSPEDTKIEEAKDVKEELVKQKSDEKMKKIEDIKEEGEKIEQVEKKVKGEEHEKMQVEDGGLRKDIARETTHEETEEPKIPSKEKNQQCLQEEMRKGKYEASTTARKFPMQIADSHGKTREGSKDKEIEESEEFKGDVAKRMRGVTEVVASTTKEKIQESESERVTKTLQEDVSKGRFQGSKVTKEEFPTKILDSPANTREELEGTKIEEGKNLIEEFPKQLVDSTINTSERLKDTKVEEAKEVKAELVKQKSEELMEKIKDVKEKDAGIEQPVKKVEGEKYEKIQVDEIGGLKKDITREATHEETEEPKILIKEQNQQCLEEEKRKRASTKPIKFPTEIVDSVVKKREGSKDKEIEDAEELNGDVAKRISGETEVVESKTKERFKESQSGRIANTLQEAQEEKHPKALEIRDLQSEKVESKGLKEIEQGSAKDKRQKTKLLPRTIQSKETHESKTESINQGTLKPKKSKEKGEGQSYTYDKEITKELEVATIEDQVAKPLSASWFPSTQQSEVDEKVNLYGGSKAKYEASLESQKEDFTEEMQNLIEMKDNQEGKPTQTLKAKNPLEKHSKKGGQVSTEDELHTGQKAKETMQEETERPKIKTDDRDQQYVPKKEYVAAARPIAEPERMETISGLKGSLEREELTIENFIDEKPRIEDEILKAGTEMVDKAKCIPESMKTTQGKEDPIISEALEKQAEPLEAISSLPSIESVGDEEAVPKNEIEELQQKELSPLRAEMKSKDPLELEKPIMERKFPKTEGHVPLPESGDREQYGYGSEDTKEPKVAGNKEELLKQDHGDEAVLEKRKGSKFAKSEEANDASRQLLKGEREKTTQTAEEKKPKMKEITSEIGKACGFKQVEEEMHETEKSEHQRESDEVTSLPSLESVGVEEAVPKNEVEEKQQKEDSPLTGKMKSKEVLKFEKPIMEWKFPKTKDHLPVPESREREQYGYGSEDTNAPKIASYQEELMKLEAKEASRQLLKGEKRKTTQTAEEKKPKLKETTLEFENASGFKQAADKLLEVGKREDQRESNEVTSKMGVEPLTMMEVTPNKEVEKKEPRKLSRPNIEDEIPMIEEAQQPKEEERLIHELELKATTSKEEGLAESNAKGNVEQKVGFDKPKESIQTAEEKKPKMKEIVTAEFEKTSAFKQVAEKFYETGKREDQSESEEVTSKMAVEPPTTTEITSNSEVERKGPRTFSKPSIENKTQMIEEAPQEKEEERLIHEMEQESTTSKEGLAQATKLHSNTKSKAEPKVDIDKPKESIQSTEGTTASELVADKVAQPSKSSSSSSTQQQFEVEEKDKDKDDADHEVGNEGSPETKDTKIDFQESTKSEKNQEDDQIENLQPQTPVDQQCINKEQEEKHGIHEIEEEKAYEQKEEVCTEDFEGVEEQKECKEEGSGGKKETKWSKILFIPLVIAGPALLVFLGVVFVRHRRARKR